MGTSGANEQAATLSGDVGFGQPAGDASAMVLVIDDEEAMRDSCTQVLQREGFEVVAVGDGANALGALTGRRPDVVLVDLKMPGMSGEDFLLRARRIDPEVVAVAITGYPTLSSAIEMMKAGAYDFLPKPFKAEELRIIMQRALQKRRLAMAVAIGERERSRMRDNFVAMVSHQLKSPAASVKGCLDTALSLFGSRVPGPCRDMMERASTKAGLMLDLMDDWLTLSRVESGGIKAASRSFDLGQTVQEAIAAAREAPEHNDVTVEFEPPERPIRVQGDPRALRELFANLVDNAMRYTPDGGVATVGLRAEGLGAVVSVADTGPGIPRGELPLVFEPFFRGQKAKERPGTGLGLAIARQIAEAHGGRLTAQSQPGAGTTFEVHLPPGEEQR